MAFKRLVRFAIGDRVSFGDLLSVNGGTYNVRRLTGDPFTKLQPTEDIIHVEKVRLASIGNSKSLVLTSTAPTASMPYRTYTNHHTCGPELPEPRK
jgi:hypothetical protein